MTDRSTIACRRDDAVYRITHDRPEVLNAINDVMLLPPDVVARRHAEVVT